MGKKSKRRQKVGSYVPATAADGYQKKTHVSDEGYAFPVPEGGWANELRIVERKLKRHPEDFELLVRATRVYRVMRQWENLKKTAENALSLPNSYNNTDNHANDLDSLSELSASRTVAENHLADDSEVGVFLSSDNVTNHIDTAEVSHGTNMFNLNHLQYAAVVGDIRLLEKVVSMGAAIDYPTREFSQEKFDSVCNSRDISFSAPPGSTALVLTCALIAKIEIELRFRRTCIASKPNILEEKRKMAECATQLVKLGAECHAKLSIPDDFPGDPYLRHLGFNNKTAFELAAISKEHDLIETMENYKNEEDKIRLVHCRCGSRLSWKDCHLGELGEDVKVFMRPFGRPAFRLSPLAPCYCKLTKKTYYDCCWLSAYPRHLVDTTGELGLPKECFDVRTADDDDWKNWLLTELVVRDVIMLGNNMEEKENRALLASLIRSRGLCAVLDTITITTIGRQSKTREMDTEVYAGCIERLENCLFLWHDYLPWSLEIPVLCQKVKQWNEALEKYCNDFEINGSERRRVMKRHMASPFASCANPACIMAEKKINEFDACILCRTVAYCSRACQKADFKQHKNECTQR